MIRTWSGKTSFLVSLCHNPSLNPDHGNVQTWSTTLTIINSWARWKCSQLRPHSPITESSSSATCLQLDNRSIQQSHPNPTTPDSSVDATNSLSLNQLLTLIHSEIEHGHNNNASAEGLSPVVSSTTGINQGHYSTLYRGFNHLLDV